MLTLLFAAALAAPVALSPEDVLARKGLVVAEIAKPGACPDPWASPEVTAWQGGHADATIAAAPYTKGSYEKLVGKGFAPTVIKLAWRDGREIDRICGCADGPATVTWLDAVAGGRTQADLHRDGLAARGGFDVTGWLELVKLHDCANRPYAAYEAARFLWDTIPKASPGDRDVRLSRVAHDLGVLALRDAAVKAEVVALRDALDPGADAASLEAWVALNRVLSDDDRTLAWFDSRRGQPDPKGLVASLAPNVFFLLVERGRWAEAGVVIDDPAGWLELWKPQKGGLDSAALGYAALRAAGRDPEAAALAKGILAVAPEGTACRLISRSVEAKAAGVSEKALAKKCADPAVVAAWEAAQ